MENLGHQHEAPKTSSALTPWCIATLCSLVAQLSPVLISDHNRIDIT